MFTDYKFLCVNKQSVNIFGCVSFMLFGPLLRFKFLGENVSFLSEHGQLTFVQRNMRLIISSADTMYTERYMGLPTPEDNLSGYEAGDVTLLVDKLEGKDLLLMHGNADDNVHYQNAAKLMKAMQERNIDFEQMVTMLFNYFIYLEFLRLKGLRDSRFVGFLIA